MRLAISIIALCLLFSGAASQEPEVRITRAAPPTGVFPRQFEVRVAASEPITVISLSFVFEGLAVAPHGTAILGDGTDILNARIRKAGRFAGVATFVLNRRLAKGETRLVLSLPAPQLYVALAIDASIWRDESGAAARAFPKVTHYGFTRYRPIKRPK